MRDFDPLFLVLHRKCRYQPTTIGGVHTLKMDTNSPCRHPISWVSDAYKDAITLNLEVSVKIGLCF